MNDIPTPRTDALEINDPMCDPAKVVTSDFARQLERELNAANKEIAAMQLRCGASAELLESFMEEFDVPEPHCNCHNGPPCFDCVDNGWLREQVQMAKRFITEAAKAKEGK